MKLDKISLLAVNNCSVRLWAVCYTYSIGDPERLDDIRIVEVWVSFKPRGLSTEISVSIHRSHDPFWVSIVVRVVSNVPATAKSHNEYQQAEKVGASSVVERAILDTLVDLEVLPLVVRISKRLPNLCLCLSHVVAAHN